MNQIIDSIAKWALSQSDDLLVGHIQGPAITTWSPSAASIPLRIWKALSSLDPDMLVIHATNAHRAKEIVWPRNVRGEALWPSEPDKEAEKAANFGLATESYGALLEKLRRNKIPPAEFIQPQGWTLASVLPPKILFVVDVDLDVSAEFALLMGALDAWASGTCRERKTVIRILTMSHEPMQYVVAGLFSGPGRPVIAKFAVPRTGRQAQMVQAGSTRDAISMMNDNIKRNPKASHSVLSFSENGNEGIEQPCYKWSDGDFIPLNRTEKEDKSVRIIIPIGVAIPDSQTQTDVVHVITGDTRRRVIFDRKINQVAVVNIKISASERQEQLNWASRADCVDSDIIIYTTNSFRQGLSANRPRRLSAATVELPGLLAGLTRFQDWPIQTRKLIWSIIESEDVGPMMIMKRLSQQRLMEINGPDMPVLCLAGVDRTIFYEALPKVNYDVRIAWLLSMPSRNPTTALVKAQMAALITIGPAQMLSFRNAVADDIGETVGDLARKSATTGFSGNFSGYGTLWLCLGLAKRVYSKYRWEKGWDCGENFVRNEYCEVVKDIMFIKTEQVFRMMELAKLLAAIISSHNVDISTCAVHEEACGMMDQSDFLDVSWCLLRAFAHQSTVMGAEDGGMVMYDTQSYRKVINTQEHVWLLALPPMQGELAEHGSFSGISTRMHGGCDTKISDWTWIPMPLIRRWSQEFGGLDGLGPPPRASLDPDLA